MSYYMRFISTSDEPVTLDAIEAALRRLGAYQLERDAAEREAGTLWCRDLRCARIEISRRGDAVMDAELDEFREATARRWSNPVGRFIVTRALTRATHIVAAQLLLGGQHSEDVFACVDRLWRWLFHAYGGLLQADAEGFYNRWKLRILAE